LTKGDGYKFNGERMKEIYLIEKSGREMDGTCDPCHGVHLGI
jgi:hypothetical protein